MLAKRLELLREIRPRLSRVAVLSLKEEWATGWPQGTQPAASALGVTLFLTEHSASRYTDAFALITRERSEGLLVPESPSAWANLRLIVDFAARSRLPAVYPWRDFPAAGGLMAYGVDPPDVFRKAATYVDRILRGGNPAEMPVERPITFKLVINLRTAKALGLTIPPSLLARADQVVE
jgi:putative tryptophan/tyrosine transport system substrate-binding protein